MLHIQAKALVSCFIFSESTFIMLHIQAKHLYHASYSGNAVECSARCGVRGAEALGLRSRVSCAHASAKAATCITVKLYIEIEIGNPGGATQEYKADN